MAFGILLNEASCCAARGAQPLEPLEAFCLVLPLWSQWALSMSVGRKGRQSRALVLHSFVRMVLLGGTGSFQVTVLNACPSRACVISGLGFLLTDSGF